MPATTATSTGTPAVAGKNTTTAVGTMCRNRQRRPQGRAEARSQPNRSTTRSGRVRPETSDPQGPPGARIAGEAVSITTAVKALSKAATGNLAAEGAGAADTSEAAFAEAGVFVDNLAELS